MPQPKRLVCFVEGKGDLAAVPILARRTLALINATDVLVADQSPYKVYGLGKLLKVEDGKLSTNWRRWLESASHQKNLAAVLLVLDGDIDRVSQRWTPYLDTHKSTSFCACAAAHVLAEDARFVRAGEAFSVAVVFAMKEFESWLLAGVESLRGAPLAGGRGVVPASASCPENVVPETIRDAKSKLKQQVPMYSETLDQGELAKAVDLDVVMQKCRSFRRFRSAIEQLVDAARRGSHVVTPSLPNQS